MAVKTKEERRERLRKGIRKRVRGTTERPRLSVFRSNTGIYAQVINDETGHTLASASSRLKVLLEQGGNKTEQSARVGRLVAERALASGVTLVVFDRSGYKYHGRVKALAEAAREAGLQF